MWRSAVQLCLGLHIDRKVNVPKAQRAWDYKDAPGVMLRGPYLKDGGLAQLARAPALQAGGQRFESVILHSFPIYNICIAKSDL